LVYKDAYKANFFFSAQDYIVKPTNATNATFFYIVVAKYFNVF